MKEWLIRQLKERRCDIVAAYLFGSSIKPDSTPGDIDLIVITTGDAGTTAWLRTVAWGRSLKAEFFKKFGMPLSLMVVTVSEWRQLDGVVVRKRLKLL